MLPVETNIKDAFKAGNDQEQNFIQVDFTLHHLNTNHDENFLSKMCTFDHPEPGDVLLRLPEGARGPHGEAGGWETRGRVGDEKKNSP